jgi:hypothetical protein
MTLEIVMSIYFLSILIYLIASMPGSNVIFRRRDASTACIHPWSAWGEGFPWLVVAAYTAGVVYATLRVAANQ